MYTYIDACFLQLPLLCPNDPRLEVIEFFRSFGRGSYGATSSQMTAESENGDE